MPRLTQENLEQLAQQARAHKYGLLVSKPASKDGFSVPETAADHQAWAWVFGPEQSYLYRSEYKTLFGIGLGDGLVGSRNEMGCLSFAAADQRLHTIEDQLADLLIRYPADQGYDVIVALHVHHSATAGGNWDHAGAVDDDAAACLDRASSTPCACDEAALRRDQAFDLAHQALASDLL